MSLKWNIRHYSPFLNLPAGEMSALSLSSDGSAMAVGLPFSGKKGGSTTVYKSKLSSKCEEGSQLLHLSFTTDGKPDESRWALEIDHEEVTQSQPFNGLPFTTFVEEICVPLDSCIKFRVFDSVSDGMDPPGVYSLMLDSKEVTQGGGDFMRGEIIRIGNCDCPVGTYLLSILA